MPLIEEIRFDRLIALARKHFDKDLRAIEVEVLRQACRHRDPADGTAVPPGSNAEILQSESQDTVTPSGRPLPGWQGPQIRSEFVRWLLTDAEATAFFDARGIRIWNVRLTETLDLTGCCPHVRLEFRHCLFDAWILLSSAELRTFSVRNSTLQRGIEAAHIKLQGDLNFDDIACPGPLNFETATIEGHALLNSMHLTSTRTCFSVQSATVANDIAVWKIRCAGYIDISSVRVGGLVSFLDARLTATDRTLNLSNARVEGGVFLKKDFESAGEVRMVGVEIGSLDCSGAKLMSSEIALSLHQATIRGGVFLHHGFESSGTIHMDGAEIGGSVSCANANFTKVGLAMSLNEAKIHGSVFLSENFKSAGTIRMINTEVDGQLSCHGAKLTATDDALFLVAASIHGGVFLNGGFETAGTIWMQAARIHRVLDCTKATLRSTGTTLALDGSRIQGNVFLRDDFESAGEIRMVGAKIGGQLYCVEAWIKFLRGDNVEVNGDFHWQRIRNPEQASLSLVGAKIRRVYDDVESWSAPGNLWLNGLSVHELSPLEVDSSRFPDRIAWLNRQPESELAEPQPWIHLAKLLEDKGRKRSAKRVIYELRRHQSRANRKNLKFGRLGQLWDRAFARLEEQPLRILVPMVLCISLGAGLFWPMQGHFAPTSENAYNAAKPSEHPLAYPKFQPIIYSIENVLPVVKLGQDEHWAPNAHDSTRFIYWSLMLMRWFLTLAGYVMGGILAAAVGARFRS